MDKGPRRDSQRFLPISDKRGKHGWVKPSGHGGELFHVCHTGQLSKPQSCPELLKWAFLACQRMQTHESDEFLPSKKPPQWQSTPLSLKQSVACDMLATQGDKNSNHGGMGRGGKWEKCFQGSPVYFPSLSFHLHTGFTDSTASLSLDLISLQHLGFN